MTEGAESADAMLGLLERVQSVDVLRLQPGDLLLFRFDCRLSQADAQGIRTAIEAALCRAKLGAVGYIIADHEYQFTVSVARVS